MNLAEKAKRRATKKRVAFLKKHPNHLATVVHSYNKAEHEQPPSPRQKRLSRLAANRAKREAKAAARPIRPDFEAAA